MTTDPAMKPRERRKSANVRCVEAFPDSANLRVTFVRIYLPS